MTRNKRLLTLLALLALFLPGLAKGLEEENPVTAKLVANVDAIVPGKPFTIGVLLQMAPGWHTYYREPGDSGLATSIEWELPPGFSVGELQWPKPMQETEPGGYKVNVYKQEVLLAALVTPPAQIAGAQVSVKGQVKWLACKLSCIPGEGAVALTLPVAPSAASGEPANQQLFQKFFAPEQGAIGSSPAIPTNVPGGFWYYLFFAFVGGLILNIMPCVLPVISLKILGFLQHGNESPGRIRSFGLAYAFGVICSFLVLAGLVIATQQAGNLAGWGMQFQSPVFVVAITTLVTLVSLNLFGLFEVTLGSSALSAASGLASKGGLAGSFFNGIFAVILATPCTAPFLGAALGFAFLQPPLVIVLFFLTVALGLALPYVLICSFPVLARLLPRPGAWMERFKVAMGFPMLATAVWLYSVAGRHYGSDVLWLGIFLVLLALAAWVYGEFVQRTRTHRGLALAIVLVLILGAYAFALENRLHWRDPVTRVSQAASEQSVGGIPWQPWSPQAVEQARSEGKPVLVDFTADWCLTCQTNKVTSLEIPSVREQLRAGNFVSLLGDYTRKNDAIGRELKRFGRAGVPLVIVYPVKGEPIVLPELLSPSIVLEALKQAAKP